MKTQILAAIGETGLQPAAVSTRRWRRMTE